MKTDNELVLEALVDGPKSTMELIQWAFSEARHGLTPHSRVADLRKQGYSIRCERVRSEQRRPVYLYTLVEEPEQLQLVS